MKVGIVIPLKSKSVSKDWGVTCENLKSTISSVDNQRSNLFECVVVGHDVPDFMKIYNLQNKKIKFKDFDTFPPPVRGLIESENQLKYEFDRCHKILAGITYLKEKYKDITHWFSLDADDLISDRFIVDLQKYNFADGVILDYGYTYFKRTGIINKENEFSAYCGSSALISDKLIKLPKIIEKNSHRSIPFGNFSHVNMRSRLVESGYNIVVADERIVMYVRDNGENISNAAYTDTIYKKIKKFTKMILRYQYVNTAIRRSFGLK